MSSFIFSSLEMLMFAFTALMLGILIYQIKRVFRGLMAVTVPLIVYGFVICVVLSGLEKERVVGGIGIWCAVLLYGLLVIAIGVITLQKQPVRPGRDAIVEAFDKMDIGVCYYEMSGRIVLCNEYMHELAENIWGMRVLNGSEFAEKLASMWRETNTPGTYEFYNSDRWFVANRNEVQIKETTFLELIVTDITGLKEKQEELEQNNIRLAELNHRLDQYGAIVDTVIREQEILNAKIMVHDRFGDLLLTAKRAMEDNQPGEDLSRILEHMKETLSSMENVQLSEETESLTELLKTAESIGVQVHISGRVPEEPALRNLVLLAIRECLTNTVKHARGHNLYVLMVSDSRLHMEITNDGIPPNKPIQFGTGLSVLATKVERMGGNMRAFTENGFMLTIDL